MAKWEMNCKDKESVINLWRYRYKNGVQDLEKAQWYLSRLIEVKKKEEPKVQGTSFGIELGDGC